VAGLDPAIHVFAAKRKDVNARHKAGHDDNCRIVFVGTTAG
jgi:hypothetical protein